MVLPKKVRDAIKATSSQLESKLQELKSDSISIYTARTLPLKLREWVFQLWSTNMKTMYENSSMGYDEVEKKEELFDEENLSRFVIISEDGQPIAFSMFRFDTESTLSDADALVVYCYEVQVDNSHRSKSIGTKLMKILERLGFEYGMEKVMLTVFVANERAIKFYLREGYELDEISPDAEEEEDYQILSKSCTKS